MAVDLGDFIETLQREVNPPGATIFTAATEDDWLGYLADAFWEARLDGFLEKWSADSDGVVTPARDGGEDLPRELVALVVVYAGIRILRNQIMNTNTNFRAKAGPVEFERQNSATMLAEMLKQLRETKNRLITLIYDNASTTPVYGFDAVTSRIFNALTHHGISELTGY